MIFKNAFIIGEFSDVFLKLKPNEILELKSKVFCKLKFSSHTIKKGRVSTHTHTHTHTQHTYTHTTHIHTHIHTHTYAHTQIHTHTHTHTTHIHTHIHTHTTHTHTHTHTHNSLCVRVRARVYGERDKETESSREIGWYRLGDRSSVLVPSMDSDLYRFCDPLNLLPRASGRQNVC